MLKGLNKKLLWVIVVWFAILQIFAPFIHAHVQADTPAYGHGLHMHDGGSFQTKDTTPTLRNVDDVQVVSLDKALVKNIKALPVPLFLMLFILPLLVISVQRYRYARNVHLGTPFYFISLTRPRAPPLR